MCMRVIEGQCRFIQKARPSRVRDCGEKTGEADCDEQQNRGRRSVHFIMVLRFYGAIRTPSSKLNMTSELIVIFC